MASFRSSRALLLASHNLTGVRKSIPPLFRVEALRVPSVNTGRFQSTETRRYASSDYVPLILQPSFWRSLVPKPLRAGAHAEGQTARPKGKEWNPATFFIIIFLLIGSQAIQMIALQRDYVQFSRETDAKLALLRDVVKRVQAGEDVDVEGALGTGDKVKEKEWEEVLRELEEEDKIIQSRRQKWRANKEKAAREAAEAAAAAEGS